MRERLIELLKDAELKETYTASDGKPVTSIHRRIVDRSEVKVLANYLLENGVIVPPCNVGDKIYRTMIYNAKLVDWEIVKMEVFADEIGFVDDSNNYFSTDDIGKTVFLTKEEAENALKERERE